MEYHTTINECNKENYPMHIYYIDYCKAFDLVEHWALERVLDRLNIEPMKNILMTLIRNSTTNLKVNNTILNDTINIHKGTKQGDSISLLLFILFISPLLWKLEKNINGINCNSLSIKTAAIMDDIVIATDNHVEMAYIIKTIKKFSKATGMQINPKKSAYAHKNNAHSSLPIIDGTPFSDLGADKSYRYLGVWINLNLN